MFQGIKHIHFIGMGGSGISALAHLALAEEKKASGSDARGSAVLKMLQDEGATVYGGHKATQVGSDVDLIIYSEAIDKDVNPEYVAAIERGIRVMSYSEALGELSETKKTVIVTGTHGKTTTTAMLGQALTAAGMDPTVIVGSRVSAFGNRNLRLGRSEWLVVEGCEYKRSFLHLEPFGVVILNCEWEHPDYYKDEADYMSAFKALITKIPEEGFVVGNGADGNVNVLMRDFKGHKIEVNNVMVQDLQCELQIPGKFNRWNAAHAYKTAELMGAGLPLVRKGLEAFTGTARRLEFKGERDGVMIFDDYAHHPTEIKATLRALKEKYPEKRLVCVFQPHQYSRTIKLLEGFQTAFGDADTVVVPSIYEARDSEADKKTLTAQRFVSKISERHEHVLYGDGFENTLKILKNFIKTGDLVVTMGAGDVYKVLDKI
jgi:UDP-N-acetylmuramate--alanine ligase